MIRFEVDQSLANRPSGTLRAYLEVSEEGLDLRVVDRDDNDYVILTLTPEGTLRRAAGATAPGLETDEAGLVLFEGED